MTIRADDTSIAIIGMAGRFPGARNIDELWNLLKAGKDARTELSDTDLLNAGVPRSSLSDPNYVKFSMKLADPDRFDAEFFGYGPKQALSIDPQQRLFLECAWEALESCGYGQIPEELSVGVFGGCGHNGYINYLSHGGPLEPAETVQRLIDTDKDFLTTRVAYKLGLTGPSVTIQTACSTSLVAVHLACRSLLDYECDVALAGGASVRLQQEKGYLHVSGVRSPDGYCRAFDAAADGTVFGDGVALVVLRRLTDAIAAGDPIQAVIRTTVVNNDGSRKIGYTAPGLRGQSELLARALDFADLQPQDISLLEAHGTGTPLGDAIELEALHKVYNTPGARRFCAIGSIKANIGHLDTASGVTGLIKVALCLKHKTLVPSVNISKPNTQLEAPHSPFYVNTELKPWQPLDARPRRGAVSSLGIGGTNAHAILEEAPEIAAAAESAVECLLPISAHDPKALRRIGDNLADHLSAQPDVNLADVAHTLQSGRRRFNWRRVVVGDRIADVCAALRERSPGNTDCVNTESSGRPVVLMFSGQGAQTPGMAAGLYATDREFAAEFDWCAHRFSTLFDMDIRGVVDGSVAPEMAGTPADQLFAQPAMFALEYCLGRMLMRSGIQPAAVIGHSIGEYAAACIAAALSAEDAVYLVGRRAQLMAAMPRGAMLAVCLTETQAREWVDHRSTSIAAVNAVDECVISGETAAIHAIAARLESQGIQHHLIKSPVAGHCPAMAPAAAALREAAMQRVMSRPAIPLVSCVSGDFASDEHVTQSDYWSNNLLLPVQFRKGLTQLARKRGSIFVEVGPGSTLTRLARRELGQAKDFSFLSTLTDMGLTTRTHLLTAVGDLWCLGADIDWGRLHKDRRPRRVWLPPYPFNSQRFSPLQRSHEESGHPIEAAVTARPALEPLLYTPAWKCAVPRKSAPLAADPGVWLLLADDTGFATGLCERLREKGQIVVVLKPAARYGESDGVFSVRPTIDRDYERVAEVLAGRGNGVRRIIHCWSMTRDAAQSAQADPFDLGYSSLLSVVQVFARAGQMQEGSVLVVSNAIWNVSGEERAMPAKAAMAALCKVLGQECPDIRFAVIDAHAPEQYVEKLVMECAFIGADPIVAYRNGLRLVPVYEQVDLESSGEPSGGICDGGLYAITDGLSEVGLALAQGLARKHQARLLLITSQPFPERSAWALELDAQPASATPAAGKIRQILAMEQSGAQVLVACVDITEEVALTSAITAAEARFGALCGLFHLAMDRKSLPVEARPAELDAYDLVVRVRNDSQEIQALSNVLRGLTLQFCVVFTGNSSILGGVRLGVHAAASAVLDSEVVALNSTSPFPWYLVNWDEWLTDASDDGRSGDSPATAAQYALTASQALAALWLIVSSWPATQVIVSAVPFQSRLMPGKLRPSGNGQVAPERGSEIPFISEAAPAQSVGYVAPRTELERTVLGFWKDVLGGEDIGVEDHFLERGGDSLIALRIIARVKDRFGVSVPPASFIGSKGTIAGVVKEIATLMAMDHDSSVVEDRLATIAGSRA